MTSFPHASGLPQRQPGSRSGLRRKGAFPPPPKSVRIWQVQTPRDDQLEPLVPSPEQVQPATSSPTFSTLVWALLALAGVLGFAVWLFVS